MEVMHIDVLLENFFDETVFESRQKEHGGPLAAAPHNAYEHGEEQQRHRKEQAVVVEIERQRAQMLFGLDLVHVEIVVELAFGEQRENIDFGVNVRSISPRQHPEEDGVEVFEEEFVQKLVE